MQTYTNAASPRRPRQLLGAPPAGEDPDVLNQGGGGGVQPYQGGMVNAQAAPQPMAPPQPGKAAGMVRPLQKPGPPAPNMDPRTATPGAPTPGGTMPVAPPPPINIAPPVGGAVPLNPGTINGEGVTSLGGAGIQPILGSAPQPKPGQPFPAMGEGAVSLGGAGILTRRADTVGQPAPGGFDQNALTDFGPGNDLRGTQINPVDNERLSTLQGQTDMARRRLTDFQQPGFEGVDAGGTYQGGPEAQRARQLSAQNLESLNSSPNRADVARQRLSDFVGEQDIDYARRSQDVGRQAAALGRIGSGMTADDIVRLGRDREGNIVREQRRLASESADQELGDRLDRLDATNRSGSTFRGEDLDTAGFNQGLRGERRGERSARQDYAQRGFENNRATFGDLASQEGQLFGQGTSRRNELRGERDYQNQQARTSIDDRIRQRMMEEELTNSSFNRDLSRSRLGLDVAGDYAQQGQADQDAAGGLIEEILRGQGGQGGQPAGVAPAQGGAGGYQPTPEEIDAILRYYRG